LTVYDHNYYSSQAKVPTRLYNVLDLLLVSDPLLVSALKVVPPFSTSDHNAINIEILYSKTKSSHSVKTSYNKQFLWKLGDYSGICDYLTSYNWNDLFMYNLTADNLWQAFRDILDYAIELFVPHKYDCCTDTVRVPFQFAEFQFAEP